MDHRAPGIFRRPSGFERKQTRSHPNGLERRIPRPPELTTAGCSPPSCSPPSLVHSADFSYPRLGYTPAKCGAMVQRLARGPFKAEIRVRFPLALPNNSSTTIFGLMLFGRRLPSCDSRKDTPKRMSLDAPRSCLELRR